MHISLFQKRKKEVPTNKQTLLELSKSASPSIQVLQNSNLSNQIKMLDLTKGDLAVAQAFKPYVEKNIYQIVDNFYKNLENEPTLLSIINEHSSIERLKKSLQVHIIEMFSGYINDQFIEKRKRIATIHVRIGLTQKWYIASFQKIFQGAMDILYENFYADEDRKVGLTAIYKLLNLEEQIVLEAYDEEMMELKEQEAKYQKDIIQSVGQTSTNLSSLAEQTTGSIEEMTGQINLITANAQTGTEMAEEAEKVSTSGSNHLHLMRNSLTGLEASTETVNDKMLTLEKTSQEIRSIIAIVQSIAEQTNLLSLNASIEAAWAGEHGRGFSVVADEVRKLAVQTEQSVKNVTDLVNETNHQVQDSATSLVDAQKHLREVQEHMQRTESAFQSIRAQMVKTKDTNKEIQDDLESMVDITEDIVKVAMATSEAAEQLNHILR